jgi:hypothetical protein
MLLLREMPAGRIEEYVSDHGRQSIAVTKLKAPSKYEFDEIQAGMTIL